MPSRADAAAAAGAEFLIAAQDDDGLWRDFRTPAGAASTWPSGYVGHALRSVGLGGAWLDGLSAALRRHQQADGGWGYHEGTPSDADSTAWALLALDLLPGTADARKRAGAFLGRHQGRRGGGVATYAAWGPVRRYTGLSRAVPFWGWCRPHVEVTAVAGRAFRTLGSPEGTRRADLAWQFVRSRQRADGSWPSYWWTTSQVATEQAMSLALLMADRAPVDEAAHWVRSRQRPDGGWSDPSDRGHRSDPGDPPPSAFLTALSLSVLAAAGPSHRAPLDRAVAALVGLQDADGGWPSSAALRIPLPPDPYPAGGDRWRPVRFGPGLVVRDEQRLFTTATCVAALSRAGHHRGDGGGADQDPANVSGVTARGGDS